MPWRRPALLASLVLCLGCGHVLRHAPNHTSIPQRLPDPPRSREPPRYLLSSSTLMLIRGKALNLAIYTSHSGPEDVEWLRTTTLRWIEELQRINLR